MTKKIMSAAAAAVLMTSGAFAFETNNAGTILDKEGKEAVYNFSNVAATPLQRSFDSENDDRMTGDALIFPAFKMNENWETEVVFRNNYSDRAVVAKVVLYKSKTSEEFLDFNVYLSANDQVRFVLDSTKTFKTSDGSVAIDAAFGTAASPNNDATKLTFASDYPLDSAIKTGFELPLVGEDGYVENDPEEGKEIESGYIVVYGIFETNLNGYEGDVNNIIYPQLATTSTRVTDNRFHKRHRELWQLYRKTMDAYRGIDTDGDGIFDKYPWRDWSVYMTNGVFTGGSAFPAPNLADRDATAPAGTPLANTLTDFPQVDGVQPVGQNALSGSVRIYSAAGAAEPRDMILPATALANFSDDNTLMLWAEREFAAIADRCINDVDGIADPNNIDSFYDVACIDADTQTFLVDNAVYTFKHDASDVAGEDVANTLLITQPTKRFLVQLSLTETKDDSTNTPGNPADIYWTFDSQDCPKEAIENHSTKGVFDGPEYGIRVDLSAVFDDDENGIGGDVDRVFSPADRDFNSVCEELTAIPNIELSGNLMSDFAQDKNGFIKVDFINATANSAIPAIITQMKATRVNGIAQTNWFYAPSNR